MERGYLGARTYEMTFPGQAQPIQQQSLQQQSPFQQTGKFEAYNLGNDPLAVREKLTDDVLNAKGQLEAFVKDSIARGIDPFQPDYSQEGGGLAFKTFQKAQANLMYAANALKLQKEFDEREREAKMRGDIRYKSTYDPTKDLSAEMNPDDVYYSTKLDPRTVANNQRTGQNYYTQQDVNAVNRATYDPTRQAIVNSYTGEEQQYQLPGVLPATKETSYQQMIDRSGGRRSGGVSQEDYVNRAELIKQIKRGIITKDQTHINMLKLVPGVEDITYINTGDKVGFEIYFKNQDQPSFIDLSKGKGEGDINALINRIEGQKNIPNEAVFNFNTKVDIPRSNAREIIDEVKGKLKSFPNASETIEDVFPKMQELASTQSLYLPDGSVISKIDKNIPWLWGNNELVITYHPIDSKGRVNYSIVKEKVLSDPTEIEDFVEYNANEIAPAFGGGFITNETSAPEIDPDI